MKKIKLFYFSFLSIPSCLILPLIINSCATSNNSKEENKPPISNDNNNNNGNESNNSNPQYFPSGDDYLKNNKIKPIENGEEVFFAMPGGGIGNKSINVSAGQKTTQPSNGVPKKAELDTSMLRNSIDQKSSKITYSLVFVDNNGGTHLGTGWILDYKLPSNNEKYPKTWYVATNAHVIQNLKVENDIISPERYNKGQYKYLNTKYVKFSILNKFDINSDIKNTSFNGNNNGEKLYEYENVLPKDKNGNMNLKTVFIGNDFLKTRPSMYSTDGRWDCEEYADFAVMEVSFKDEETARKMTNNYYENKSIHFKYKKESLLKNPNNIKDNTFNVFGYPANSNGTFEQYATPLTNKPKDLNNNKEFLNGGRLASSKYYNSFQERFGMFDASIGLSFFRYKYRIADPKDILANEEEDYSIWGLLYPMDYDNLKFGSSGSMMVDKNGYTWGIHFAMDDDVSIGFAQALYCEGFNYDGYYGSYNLQGYDLIEGGFPNQKKSYKDGLKILYKNDSSFKTNIFENGLL